MKLPRLAMTLLLCSAILLLPFTKAKAGTVLLGQVRPDDLADTLGWCVEVSANIEGVGILPGSPKMSTGDIYTFEVDQNVVVNFILSRPNYRSKRVPSIPVTSSLGNPYRIMPNVKLNKIKKGSQSSLSRPPQNRSAPKRTVSHHVQQAALQKEREELRKELEEQAELARASKSLDIFQFNLEVYADVYRNEPAALKDEIVQFKSDAKFRDVTVAPEGRAELYQKMVQRERGENVEIPAENLLRLATDSSVSPSVRIQSVRTMTFTTLGSNETDFQMRDFLRQNVKDSASHFFLPSLIQLIQIGNKEDKDEILKDLEAGNPLRTPSIMSAIEATQWKEGQSALNRLISRNDVSPIIKESAQEMSLRSNRTVGSPNAYSESLKTQLQEYFSNQTSEKSSRAAPMNRTTSQRVALTGESQGTTAELQVTPRPNGLTQLEMRFRFVDALKDKVNNYVMWALDRDGKAVRLGQIVNAPNRRDAKIETETSLKDFSIFVTAEKDDTVAQPQGPVLTVIKNVQGGPN